MLYGRWGQRWDHKPQSERLGGYNGLVESGGRESRGRCSVGRVGSMGGMGLVGSVGRVGSVGSVIKGMIDSIKIGS